MDATLRRNVQQQMAKKPEHKRSTEKNKMPNRLTKCQKDEQGSKHKEEPTI